MKNELQRNRFSNNKLRAQDTHNCNNTFVRNHENTALLVQHETGGRFRQRERVVTFGRCRPSFVKFELNIFVNHLGFQRSTATGPLIFLCFGICSLLHRPGLLLRRRVATQPQRSVIRRAENWY